MLTIKKIVTCAGIALTTTLLTATPASADTYSVYWPGAIATWHDGGNTMVVQDTGTQYDAAMQLIRPSGVVETIYALGGNGTSKSKTLYHINENEPISIRACQTRRDLAIISCSSWTPGTS